MTMGLSFLLQPCAPNGSDLATQPERKTFLGLASSIDSDDPPAGGGSGTAIYLLLMGVG